MYAICSVKKDDVKNCVEAMKEANHRGDLIQTSGKKYTMVDRNRDHVKSMHDKMSEELYYLIDMETLTIHDNAECPNCAHDQISARLINLKSTGLPICSCVK